MSDFILAVAVILIFAFVLWFLKKNKLFYWRRPKNN